MKLITRQLLANTAALRWGEIYARWPAAASLAGGDRPGEILNRLNALGPTPDPDAVDAVIGNGAWTHMTCDECGEVTDAVVELGQEPDCESATAKVCAGCLATAAATLREPLHPAGREKEEPL